MAGQWFTGLGQLIAGGIAYTATLGQVKAVTDWTIEGAHKVRDNNHKTWGQDGKATKYFESMPGVGFIISAGHAIAGDQQRARRAAAKATKSTLVIACAIVGGFIGPQGAGNGAAVGSAIGQFAEMGINHYIREPYRTDAGTYDEFDETKYILVVSLEVFKDGVSNALVFLCTDNVAIYMGY